MGDRVKVGIRQVAAESGVSTATVSQVYNNKGEVAEATRKRVLEVGARLNYRPDALAQALRTGRSRVLGIVISYRDSAVWEQTYMPYYRDIIAGAAIEAVEHGYSISAAPSSEDGRISTHIPLEGVIVVDPIEHDPIVEYCASNGIAVITDGRYESGSSELRHASVYSDMMAGVPAVLDHMAALETGPEFRPALFAGPRLDSYTADTTRYFAEWCAKYEKPLRVTTLTPGQAPIDAARALLAGGASAVTAVHCINETYRAAVAQAAQELHIAIPAQLQISVVGNARGVNADLRANYLNIDPVQTGAVCARTLVALLEGENFDTTPQPVSLVPARS